MKLPYSWLTDLVKVPDGVDAVAATLALRGFEVASIERSVIDVEITANRPDCLSIIGLAREASAAYSLPLAVPDRKMPPALTGVEGPALSGVEGQPLDVAIEDAELCPRYCAQMFELGPGGVTPEWMRERLDACGVRTISPVVDVTNYVMLEIGQPTHAFDYAKLAGGALRIRRAKPGERIRTLDGVDRALDRDMLVIADADRAQAVGGVMGGADSEISGSTTLMVLESAYFAPASVRRTSRRLALKTEASTRFERGADVEAAALAIARAAALFEQIGAARPVGPTIDRYPSPRRPVTLTLRSSRIQHVLGIRVADSEVPARLEPLGFSIDGRGPTSDDRHPTTDDRRPMTDDREVRDRTSHVGRLASDTRWLVGVPTFRVDVQREIDLIEEIARHDGYKTLPATFPELRSPQPPPDPRTSRDRLLRQLLTACGMSEAVTFSFIEAAPAAEYAKPPEIVAIANPLSETFAVLRPSLLPGLVDAAAHNRRRQHEHVRLFETGTRFRPTGETRAVAGVWCGAGVVPHWSGRPQAADFYDVKGVVETICRGFGVEPAFEPADVRYLVRGRSASIFCLKESLGVIGQIVPAIADARGFPPHEPLWAFELDTDALGSALQRASGQADPGDSLRAESLPRFPSILRDLSVLVDAALPAAAVRGTIRTAAPATLTEVIEFDRYRGKGVPEGRVSLSLRLRFRSLERTLTDAEVDEAMQRIVAALTEAHGAVRR